MLISISLLFAFKNAAVFLSIAISATFCISKRLNCYNASYGLMQGIDNKRGDFWIILLLFWPVDNISWFHCIGSVILLPFHS